MGKIINWWKNKFWMKCDKCREPMKQYTLQGLTNIGCIYYCEKCAEEYQLKCLDKGVIPMERNYA